MTMRPTVQSPGSPAPGQKNAPGTKTITIIDGKTGARQEVVIPDGGNAGNSTSAPPLNQNLVEMTPRGPIPKIAADGTRPSEAFARPVKPLPGKPDAPRVALIISGLGVSASGTAEAVTKMPEAVTLAFMPYGPDVERLVARARGEGHEILLQVPLEPFGYPENDSGPQTLLTSLTPEQNLERLHWLMSRFQGYVGIVGAMGARFTASEQSFAPIMREIAKRGLIFVDDGANARSVAGRIAGGNSSAFRQSRHRSRCGADARRNRSRPRPPGNGGARALVCGRHSVRAAGIDRAYREMGEGGRKPRRAAGANHGHRRQGQAELDETANSEVAK